MNEREALQKAIKAANTQTELAEKLSELRSERVTQQRIAHWVKVGRVSAGFAISVEKVTGVPRYELRPDLYPPEEYAA